MHPNPLLFLFLVFIGLHQHLIKFQTQLLAWDLPTGCSRSGCKTWDASTPGFSCSSSTDTAFPLTLHGQQLVAFSIPYSFATQRWHRMPLTLPVSRLFAASCSLFEAWIEMSAVSTSLRHRWHRVSLLASQTVMDGKMLWSVRLPAGIGRNDRCTSAAYEPWQCWKPSLGTLNLATEIDILQVRWHKFHS